MKYSPYNSAPLFIVGAIVALIVTSQAFAQESETEISASTNDATQPTKEQILQKIEDRATARTEVREGRQVILDSKFQERIINLSTNVTKRLVAGNERMRNIIERLETRIEKLKTLGIHTEDAEAKLAEAKSSLVKTTEIIEGFESVQTAIGSDTPRESFTAIRAQFTDARIAILKTQLLLRDTIRILKNEVEASESGRGVREAVRNSTDMPEPTTAQ